MKRVVLSDIHIPFHDKRALGCAMAFIRDIKPDAVDLLGDIIDCYPLSKFDKDPERKETFQDEIDQAVGFLTELRTALPKAEIIYSEGNHEDRLRKYKWGVAKELANLSVFSLPYLLRLEHLNISYRDYHSPYKVRGLWYYHGDTIRKHCGVTGLAHLDKIGGSVIVGHSHRLGTVRKSDWNSTRTGYENGCLCDLRPQYIKGAPNWQQGLSLVTYYDKGYEVEQLQIVRGALTYHGYEYTA